MTTRKPAPKEEPRPGDASSLGGLDRVLHERSRLAILIALLSRPEGAVFPELKKLCGFTDGNLNRHLAVLHAAGVDPLPADEELETRNTAKALLSAVPAAERMTAQRRAAAGVPDSPS